MFLMLLSLLLQIQPVFTCEMMEQQGPAKHCCCDDTTDIKDSEDLQDLTEQDKTVDNDSSCCEFSNQITVKGSDLEEVEDTIISSHLGLELPQEHVILILASLWATDFIDPKPKYTSQNIPPSTFGNDIYLSTQRLRI